MLFVSYLCKQKNISIIPETMDKTNTSKFANVSVMFCFFAMGFVDLVGTASNFVKEDLGLNDSIANLMPSLVFFWF